MISIFTGRLRHIFFIVLLVSITSCANDSDTTTTTSQSTDIKTPVVVKTVPAAGEVGIGPNVVIEVAFNEDIQAVQANKIEIYPYNLGVPDITSAIQLAENNPIVYDSASKTLLINALPNQYKPANIYQVTLSNIKDIAGNQIESPCTWLFAMGGAGAPTSVGNSNTGLCGETLPITEVPGEPQNVNVLLGNGTVTLTWEAPVSGVPDYYKIDV